MTTDSITSLEDLADKVDDEFTPYKQPTEFKSISLINDTSSPDRPTLIIHVDGEEASSVADRVEKVCADHGAHTQRSATDLRVWRQLSNYCRSATHRYRGVINQ